METIASVQRAVSLYSECQSAVLLILPRYRKHLLVDIRGDISMRNLVLVLIAVAAVPTAFGQDLSCSENECSSTYVIGHKQYTTTCTSGYGTLSCHTSDPDSSYDAGAGIRAFMAKGMTFEEAMKAEEARHEAVMMESPDELKARHELCDEGVWKPDRCDFSKPHPNGYQVPPPQPPPQFQEGTPGELTEAIKTGNASKCIINIFPAGADIFVDGVQVGRPLEPFIIVKKDKPRKIAVKLDGYKPVEKQVTPDGNLIVLGFMLEKAPDSQASKAVPAKQDDRAGKAGSSRNK